MEEYMSAQVLGKNVSPMVLPTKISLWGAILVASCHCLGSVEWVLSAKAFQVGSCFSPQRHLRFWELNSPGRLNFSSWCNWTDQKNEELSKTILTPDSSLQLILSFI